MQRMTEFCVGYLGLSRSRRIVQLISDANQVAETGARGLTGVAPDGSIVVAIDDCLTEEQYMTTLVHEMIHVKQLASGLLTYRMVNGVEFITWRGKDASNLGYLSRPWELQAMAQTEIIVRKFYAYVETLV